MKAKAWIDLQDALNYPATSDSGERDPFRFDRVLVATVAKGLEWNPGDRMMWTRIFVQPINFAFAGYSVAATDNETVKIASLESTSSRKFSADLSATIPGMEAPKASVGAGGEQSVKTTADVNAQYEKLGIDITRGFLRDHPRKRDRRGRYRQYDGRAYRRDRRAIDLEAIPGGQLQSKSRLPSTIDQGQVPPWPARPNRRSGCLRFQGSRS